MTEHTDNRIELSGKIIDDPEYSHTIYQEDFYTFLLEVLRMSGKADILPCTIPHKLLTANNLLCGSLVHIAGQLRSYNKIVDGVSRLNIQAFVLEIGPYGEDTCINRIELAGYLCKTPVYRETPFGREITDMLIAINRAYNKSDYIPIIAWGKNARTASKLKVGQKIEIEGRLQSREYEKTMPDGKHMTRTAYEVSLSTLQVHAEL